MSEHDLKFDVEARERRLMSGEDQLLAEINKREQKVYEYLTHINVDDIIVVNEFASFGYRRGIVKSRDGNAIIINVINEETGLRSARDFYGTIDELTQTVQIATTASTEGHLSNYIKWYDEDMLKQEIEKGEFSIYDYMIVFPKWFLRNRKQYFAINIVDKSPSRNHYILDAADFGALPWDPSLNLKVSGTLSRKIISFCVIRIIGKTLMFYVCNETFTVTPDITPEEYTKTMKSCVHILILSNLWKPDRDTNTFFVFQNLFNNSRNILEKHRFHTDEFLLRNSQLSDFLQSQHLLPIQPNYTFLMFDISTCLASSIYSLSGSRPHASRCVLYPNTFFMFNNFLAREIKGKTVFAEHSEPFLLSTTKPTTNTRGDDFTFKSYAISHFGNIVFNYYKTSLSLREPAGCYQYRTFVVDKKKYAKFDQFVSDSESISGDQHVFSCIAKLITGTSGGKLSHIPVEQTEENWQQFIDDCLAKKSSVNFINQTFEDFEKRTPNTDFPEFGGKTRKKRKRRKRRHGKSYHKRYKSLKK